MTDPLLTAAANNAISTLTQVYEQVQEALEQFKHLVNDPRSVEQLVADPNSPVNASRTLAVLRLEAAAQREALRPFAQAYSRMAEPLDDMQITVFVDANRPDKNKYVYMGDFKRAHKAYSSLSVGAEIAARLQQLETDAHRAGQLLAAWLADDAPFTQEDLEDSKRLAAEYGSQQQSALDEAHKTQAVIQSEKR